MDRLVTPQIQEGAQACHVNRRSQASVEEEVMKDRPALHPPYNLTASSLTLGPTAVPLLVPKTRPAVPGRLTWDPSISSWPMNSPPRSWTYRWAGLLSRIHGKSVNTKRLQQWGTRPIDLEVDLSPLNLIQPGPTLRRSQIGWDWEPQTSP